ncbi:hypothetical protein P5673_020750 [Acropora cervicornis]|uniref:Uncharacterized protein n=1 Tax=Acropora cervicornis TaxID=6130 RepID=A0AAD9Q9L3_ACRCE|nr:hypothetical protein P5673_020750 [Acropora cervicornis]
MTYEARYNIHSQLEHCNPCGSVMFFLSGNVYVQHIFIPSAIQLRMNQEPEQNSTFLRIPFISIIFS